jgi:hypothetical protein
VSNMHDLYDGISVGDANAARDEAAQRAMDECLCTDCGEDTCARERSAIVERSRPVQSLIKRRWIDGHTIRDVER